MAWEIVERLDDGKTVWCNLDGDGDLAPIYQVTNDYNGVAFEPVSSSGYYSLYDLAVNENLILTCDD